MVGNVGRMALGNPPCILEAIQAYQERPVGWPSAPAAPMPPQSTCRSCAEHSGSRGKLKLRVCCFFFPRIDNWDLQRGRAELCSTKATNRNGFISRSARGLQKGPGAAGGARGCAHSDGLCLESTSCTVVCTQHDGQCPKYTNACSRGSHTTQYPEMRHSGSPGTQALGGFGTVPSTL